MKKRINRQAKKITKKMHKQALCMLVFSAAFSILGYFVPHIYYEYYDTTEYLTIQTPIRVDKETYRPGDEATLSSTYTALTDIVAKSYNNWIRINNDGAVTKVGAAENIIIYLKAENAPFSVTVTIPESFKSGNYFLSGIKEYKINGVTKQYAFVTETFTVTE